MEQMAETSVSYNSDDYKTALNTFLKNYEEVINTARENNIPILISTLVRNENDLHPFVSFHSESITDSLKNYSGTLYRLGLDKMNDSDYTAASEYFIKSLAVDSLPADVHYSLGKCYEQSGEYDKAERQFSLAADLDGLRFRAPSDFNNIVYQLGNELKVPVADVNSQFRQNSKNGIIGSNLLIDHVHPNIRGYFLLAKTWFQALKKNRLLGLSSEIVQSDSLLWSKAAVTQLDSLIGAIKIMELKSRPPFTQTDSSFNFVPVNAIEQFASQYVIARSLSWAETHLNVAKSYLAIGNFNSALNELRAILVSDEDNPRILKLAGDMLFQLNRFREAESYYLKAYKLDANQFIEYKLGKTELVLGRPDLAIQFLTSALEKNQKGQDKFNTGETQDIYYSLSEAYNKNHQPDKAREYMQKLFK
jgi:tetratricopeptide (TPR) repeat protein